MGKHGTVFIHGLDSSNRGTKARYFARHFPGMLIPNFSGSLDQRMESLRAHLEGYDSLILVGSSYGGLMATLFAFENETRVSRVILLAPALNFEQGALPQNEMLSLPVWVFIGSGDTVTPVSIVRPVAERLFTNCRFSVVDDDHLLHKTFTRIDWSTLLT